MIFRIYFLKALVILLFLTFTARGIYMLFFKVDPTYNMKCYSGGNLVYSNESVIMESRTLYKDSKTGNLIGANMDCITIRNPE